MTPEECSKHNARRQTLKTCEHLREARQKLILAYQHLKLIRNAGRAKGVEAFNANFLRFGDLIDNLYLQLDDVFNVGIDLSHALKDSMEQPDHLPPPIVGRYLSYTDLTPLQRSLIREGHEAIAKASRNAIPETYYNKMDHEPRPPKIIKPAPIHYQPPKPKDSRMPL